MEKHMQVIGFIGVGMMGGAIAARMMQRGFSVLAYDKNPEVLDRSCAEGAARATSVREVVDRADIVFACLPTPEISRSVALEKDGVVEGSAVKIYVDLSTLGGATALKISEALAKKGITYLDGAVVGPAFAVQAGTLGVLAAGPIAAFERVKPILESFAGKIFYLGEEIGRAQVAKVVANAVSYAGLFASFEAVAVGLKAGIDMESLVGIINQGSGANFHTQKIFPAYIIPGRFEGTGAVEIGVKDVKLFLAEAKRLKAETPMATSVSALSVRAAESGPAGRDTMTLFHYFCDLAGVPRRG
jgi:3-hydroxyisobutyrate dehydrogenase-like beta-hydroxyacid dehydrogenase